MTIHYDGTEKREFQLVLKFLDIVAPPWSPEWNSGTWQLAHTYNQLEPPMVRDYRPFLPASYKQNQLETGEEGHKSLG